MTKTSCWFVLISSWCILQWQVLEAFTVLRNTPISHQRAKRSLPLAATKSKAPSSSITAGDCILVVGGTGGVGQLVTRKLHARGDVKVRVTSRSKERGQEAVACDDIDVVELDLVQGSDSQIKQALQNVAGVVISVGTTAFPTLKWQNGNTPEAIDKIAVTRLATAAASIPTLKKIVLLTSIGVERKDQMPFKILNLFGVLDAKKSGEEAVKSAVQSRQDDSSYVIIRPGRLVGGPFTNYDIPKLLQLEGGAENGVSVAAGDTLLGDCKRDACAESVVQCLMNDACRNVELCIVSNEEKALNDQQWSEVFQKMQVIQ